MHFGVILVFAVGDLVFVFDPFQKHASRFVARALGDELALELPDCAALLIVTVGL